MWPGMWVTSHTGSVGWDLRKVSSVFGRRRWTFACSLRPCGGCHTSFGADGKVSIERWYRSPYVEKPFNSKVIKSFVPELRSRKCFLCFGIPMLYMNILWKLYVRYTYSCMGMLHISFSGTSPGLWIYYLVVWPNCNCSQIFLWITSPSSCALFKYLRVSLQLLLIMRSIGCSPSPHNLPLIFFCVLSISS